MMPTLSNVIVIFFLLKVLQVLFFFTKSSTNEITQLMKKKIHFLGIIDGSNNCFMD